MRAARFFIAAVGLLCAGIAQAIEFKSVGQAPAILYDAPTTKGRKVFVAPRGMPVEVVLTYGEWTKIRDARGDLSWIESRALAPRRNVIVSGAVARVRESASDSSPVLFTAEKGVLLELVDSAAAGWVRVRHRDGQAGFVKPAEIWGE